MSKKIFLTSLIIIFFSGVFYAQKSTESNSFREPFKVCFNNKTSKTVYVSVRYKNLNDVWVTKYWYKFKPYQKDEEDNKYTFKTYNRYFYFYAREKSKYNGSYSYWGGNDNYVRVDGKSVGMKEKYISRDRFEKQRGQSFYVNLKL